MAGSCGFPLDGVSVRLENQDPETGVGELVVAGDNGMEEDWGRPAWGRGPFFVDPVTGIQCLRTGDLFQVKEDGFLYFCGRKDNCLKIRGFRVGGAWPEEPFLAYPEVLEALLQLGKLEVTPAEALEQLGSHCKYCGDYDGGQDVGHTDCLRPNHIDAHAHNQNIAHQRDITDRGFRNDGLDESCQ